ncbi:MAG: hypothetical protein QG553_51 [Patescibacteria group bacterium]|nr:hypothetical protein [Patescibacteria group bacterium]
MELTDNAAGAAIAEARRKEILRRRGTPVELVRRLFKSRPAPEGHDHDEGYIIDVKLAEGTVTIDGVPVEAHLELDDHCDGVTPIVVNLRIGNYGPDGTRHYLGSVVNPDLDVETDEDKQMVYVPRHDPYYRGPHESLHEQQPLDSDSQMNLYSLLSDALMHPATQ